MYYTIFVLYGCLIVKYCRDIFLTNLNNAIKEIKITDYINENVAIVLNDNKKHSI